VLSVCISIETCFYKHLLKYIDVSVCTIFVLNGKCNILHIVGPKPPCTGPASECSDHHEPSTSQIPLTFLKITKVRRNRKIRIVSIAIITDTPAKNKIGN